MKITKRQLRKIIKEQADYMDPMTYMDKIDNMDDSFQDLKLGSPFRSAGVRMALAEMESAYLELGKAMRAELDVTKIVGD